MAKLQTLLDSHIKLEFINRYRDTWPAGIACLSGGTLDLKSLISHTFPLEKAADALTLASDYRNGSIKVHIVDEVDSPVFRGPTVAKSPLSS
ncbi:hypothetical protein LY76DRAFT_650028 [Colletotrichum caudatum]|nr:hypothetical protein LY76DRAFT_650028 [Colletotrichum caudatum]